jgi:Type II restriction endonuclease EcoO109I
MQKLNLKDVTLYVENNIGEFHKKRIERVKNLKLNEVLLSKNPYLFKAKHQFSSEQIIRSFVDARISSSEETIFGDWLEGLAIFINTKVYNGRKSGIKGIDLEFDNDNKRHIITIKSGPNWGNSSQVEKMLGYFNSARKTLLTSNSKLNIVAINGCCYGIDNQPYKTENYYKFCGQKFWEFISGDKKLYLNIIEPLGHQAKERNEEFLEYYNNMINKFSLDFMQRFCNVDGSINWNELVIFNSGK